MKGSVLFWLMSVAVAGVVAVTTTQLHVSRSGRDVDSLARATCVTEPGELRNCRNGTFWFQPTAAKTAKDCHAQLPTAAQNHTTDFLTDPAIIVEGTNFSICACCRENKRVTACKLVSGAVAVAALNVTYV